MCTLPVHAASKKAYRSIAAFSSCCILALKPAHWAIAGFACIQDAAHWLMDQEDVYKSEARWHAVQEQRLQEAAENAKREKASRRQLLDKYHLQAVNTSACMPSSKPQQAPKSKVCRQRRVVGKPKIKLSV